MDCSARMPRHHAMTGRLHLLRDASRACRCTAEKECSCVAGAVLAAGWMETVEVFAHVHIWMLSTSTFAAAISRPHPQVVPGSVRRQSRPAGSHGPSPGSSRSTSTASRARNGLQRARAFSINDCLCSSVSGQTPAGSTCIGMLHTRISRLQKVHNSEQNPATEA